MMISFIYSAFIKHKTCDALCANVISQKELQRDEQETSVTFGDMLTVALILFEDRAFHLLTYSAHLLSMPRPVDGNYG